MLVVILIIIEMTFFTHFVRGLKRRNKTVSLLWDNHKWREKGAGGRDEEQRLK